MAPRKQAKKAETENTSKPDEKKSTPSAKEKEVIIRYVSTRVVLFHPFAKVHIPLGPPGIILETPDSWLDCQIERGLIKEM